MLDFQNTRDIHAVEMLFDLRPGKIYAISNRLLRERISNFRIDKAHPKDGSHYAMVWKKMSTPSKFYVVLLPIFTHYRVDGSKQRYNFEHVMFDGSDCKMQGYADYNNPLKIAPEYFLARDKVTSKKIYVRPTAFFARKI